MRDKLYLLIKVFVYYSSHRNPHTSTHTRTPFSASFKIPQSLNGSTTSADGGVLFTCGGRRVMWLMLNPVNVQYRRTYVTCSQSWKLEWQIVSNKHSILMTVDPWVCFIERGWFGKHWNTREWIMWATDNLISKISHLKATGWVPVEVLLMHSAWAAEKWAKTFWQTS